MRLPRVGWLAVAMLAVGTSGGTQSPSGSETIAVVVGRASFVTDVSRDDLRELYLRRQRVWANGAVAIPVNLPAGHALREDFSRIVLGRSSRDLVSYWNGRYFEGIRPPVVLPSVAAVRAYIAAEPGAVGYLPVAEVDDGCKVLLKLPAR